MKIAEVFTYIDDYVINHAYWRLPKVSFDLNNIDDRVAPDYKRFEYMPEGMYDLEVITAEYRHFDHCATIHVVVRVLGYSRVAGVISHINRISDNGLNKPKGLPEPLIGDVARFLLYVDDENTAAIVLDQLRSMGITDTHEWLPSNNRPFSREFPAVADRLRGLRFRAHRRYAVGADGHVRHRFNIVRPLTVDDEKVHGTSDNPSKVP